jgi:methionyl-tRNA formyltransferase
VRVVFAGTPTFAASALAALLRGAINVVAVYTQPDRPAGRGLKLTPSPVKTLAVEHGLRVFQPPTLRAPESQAELAALKPDLLVVAAYGLILPQAVLDIPRLGCLNIHASLLPRWRGAAPIHRAILAGDRETGVCIMRMEAGLDTGAVLLEKRTPITAEDTTGSLHDRLAALGAEAIVEVLRKLSAGETLPEAPQASDGVTYASKITPEEAQIRWRDSAEMIERSVRAFNPAPGAWTTFGGEKVKVWKVRVVPASSFRAARDAVLRCEEGAVPGRILMHESELWVRCGASNTQKESVLAIEEIQRAGGKRVPASAWLSGNTAQRDTAEFN